MKTFEMKTAIHFGDNALERLKTIPYQRILVITDPYVVQSKMIDLITDPLKAAGKEYDLFFDVVPDATREWNPEHAPQAITMKRVGMTFLSTPEGRCTVRP